MSINTKKKGRVLLYGGAFDPFHNGHLAMIQTVKETLERLEKLVLIPSASHPHKEDSNIQDKHRISMLRLVAEHEGDCEVSPFELNKGGTSWSIETLNHFRELFPEKELCLLIGSDQYFNFHRWKSYDEILEKSRLVVVNRGSHVPHKDYEDYGVEELGQAYEEVIFVTMTPVDISSTQIRGRLITGGDITGLVPAFIQDYCKTKGVLGTEKK